MTEEYTEIDTYIADGIKVSILKFKIPLNHFDKSNDEKINVVIKVVNNFCPKISKNKFDIDTDIRNNSSNLILFLQGGPGFPSPIPTSISDPSYLKPLLNKNYTVILLDQRGTGLSSPIDVHSLTLNRNVEQQFEYISNFRADSIVKDCEFIRNILIKDEKWSLLGQSYGGFTSISYASFYPDSLKTIFLTGGLPPLTIKSVDDVYNATIERTKERNIGYYKKFPNDISKINYIVQFLKSNPIKLPNDGLLTIDRFRSLGLVLGGANGSLNLHNLVTTIYEEITTSSDNSLTYSTKLTIMNYLGFETNILYFLFQEAIYINGKGIKSNWSADRVLKEKQNISYNHENMTDNYSDKFMFTGEIVTKSMLEYYKELQPLSELAEYIHNYDNWSIIYDIGNLKQITWDKLPIVAYIYLDDQYVDYEISRRNSEIFEFKFVVTNQLFHNGLRVSPYQVIDQLHRLIDYGDYM